MVEELQKDPSKLKLGGERREMTFMFMDICGFTPISEHYKNNDDPEGLVELINKFLDMQTKIIINNRGTIDKYMDCIMSFWNAPLDCEDHAELAVKSALEVLDATEKLNEELKPLNLPPINVGIGISTVSALSETYQNLDLTIPSSEMPLTWDKDLKDKQEIMMGWTCCYRTELINSVRQEHSDKLIQLKLKERKNKLRFLPVKTEPTKEQLRYFYIINFLDMSMSYYFIKNNPNIREGNFLLPDRPSANSLYTKV